MLDYRVRVDRQSPAPGADVETEGWRGERNTPRAPLLADVTAQLADTMDPQAAGERLARALVPSLADWCVVTLVDDGESREGLRHLHDVASWHHVPELRHATAAYSAERIAALTPESFLSRAVEGGRLVEVRSDATARLKRVMAESVHPYLDRLAPESLAVLPLIRAGRTVGVLSVFRDATRAPLTSHELRTLREAAAAAALGLDNARRYRRQRDVAETLQLALLTPPVQPDHVQVVVRYRPAGEATRVGGDWYDAFMQPDGATMLVIGDVSGHDVEAAAVMSQLRSILRGIAVFSEEGPAALLEALDRAMRTLRITTFATVLVARLEQTPDERERGVTRLRWSSAGHLPAMVVNADGTVLALTGQRPGPLLGVLPDTPRTDNEVTLDRGATVLLYTDGLIENRVRPLRGGIAELRTALAGTADEDLDHLVDRLLAELPAPVGEDDVAVLAARLHPQDRARPAAAGPNVVRPDITLADDGM